MRPLSTLAIVMFLLAVPSAHAFAQVEPPEAIDSPAPADDADPNDPSSLPRQSVATWARPFLSSVVQVHTAWQGRLEGRLVYADAQTVVIEGRGPLAFILPARAQATFNLRDVWRISVVEHDSPINGILVGAIMAFACARGVVCHPPHLSNADTRRVVVLGALLGGAIDTSLYSRTTIYGFDPASRYRRTTRVRFAFRF